MAVKSKKEVEYIPKSITTTIRATARMSIKLRDNFYTFEYQEERQILENAILEKERILLWDDCYNEVNHQVQQTIDDLKNNNK